MPRTDSHYEIMVQERGYPLTSTNSLDPNSFLGRHFHRDNNTHLIVSGSMTFIQEIIGPGLRTQKISLECGPGQWFHVPGGMYYEGVVGRWGVTFVEGRTAASPTFDSTFGRMDIRDHHN